jgi:hypothetical protein
MRALSAPEVTSKILLAQNPLTVACLKMASPELSRIGSLDIAPNETSVPFSPSSPKMSPLASPPTESTPAASDASPTNSRTRFFQPSLSVDTALPMPTSANSAMPASRRTKLTTWMPRALASIASVLPTAPFAVFWMNHWPGSRCRYSSSITALSGMAISWQPTSSLIASGSGITAAAGAST